MPRCLATATLALALLARPTAADTTTRLQIAPQAITVGGAGTLVQVTLDDASGLYGLDVRLAFDPALLEIVDADATKDGVQVTPGQVPSPDFCVRNEVDNATGTVWYAVSQMNPRAPASGGGTSFSFTVRGWQDGAGPIEIVAASLVDRDGQALPVEVTGGAVSVTLGAAPLSGDPSPTASPTAGPTRTRTPTPAATAAPSSTPEPDEVDPTATPEPDEPDPTATDAPTVTPTAPPTATPTPTGDIPPPTEQAAPARDASPVPSAAASAAPSRSATEPPERQPDRPAPTAPQPSELTPTPSPSPEPTDAPAPAAIAAPPSAPGSDAPTAPAPAPQERPLLPPWLFSGLLGCVAVSAVALAGYLVRAGAPGAPQPQPRKMP